MPKKRLFLASALVGVAAPALVLFCTANTRIQIDDDAYSKIDVGMSEQEISIKLGGPPGEYSREPRTASCLFTKQKELPGDGDGVCQQKVWTGDDHSISIFFDGSQRATSIFLLRSMPREPSLFERFRLWFGLRST